MKNVILGISIFLIICIGIIYYRHNDSLSLPYRIIYNSQLSINDHSFIGYGKIIRDNPSSYAMDSVVLSRDTLSHILFSLSGRSSGSLLSIPSSYVVPTISYTSKKIKKLIDILAITGIILPLQDGWKLSGMNYDSIENYSRYKRGQFTGLLVQSLPGYTNIPIPYQGTYNLYCIPSILTFLFQKNCTIKVKINIDLDEIPIIITSIIDFVVSPIR